MFCALPCVCRADAVDDFLSATFTVPIEVAVKWAPKGDHDKNAEQALKFATEFSATKDFRYASTSIKIMRAYAGTYTAFRDKFHGGRMSGAIFEQLLDEAVWLVTMSEAYDLLSRVKAVPKEDADFIAAGLFIPAVEVLMGGDMPNNHQWWYDSAIGSAGFAIGRKDFVEAAINGPKGFKKIIPAHVNDDGLLFEASILYHYYALRAFTRFADIAYAHGVDLYNARMDDATPRDGANGKKSVKMMFDAPLYFAFQDGTMPTVKDSGSPGGGVSVEVRDLTAIYEKHYKDPARLAMMKRYLKILDAAKNRRALPKCVNTADESFALNGKNVMGSSLFPSTGYAIMRSDPVDPDAMSLNVTYGPYGGGHGHPDKLAISLYSKREIILPDLGRYEYGDPLQLSWIKQTLSHNTVVVDMKSQAPMNVEGMSVWAESPPDKSGILRDFTVTPRMKTVNVTDVTSVRGVTLDRSDILYDGLLLDVYRAGSKAKHTYDYTLHINGKLIDGNLALAARKAPLGKGFGYQALKNVRCAAKADGARWTTVWKTPAGNRFSITSFGFGSEVCVADAPGNPPGLDMPVLIVRGKAESAVFVTLVTPIGKDEAPPLIKIKESLNVTPANGSRKPPPDAFSFSMRNKNYLFILAPPGGDSYTCAPLGGGEALSMTTDARAVAASAPVGSASLKSLSDANVVFLGVKKLDVLKSSFLGAEKRLDYMEFVWKKGKLSEMNIFSAGKNKLLPEWPFAGITGYSMTTASLIAYGKKNKLFTTREIPVAAGRASFTFSGRE